MPLDTLKEELLVGCKSYVKERLERIRNTISDIESSLTSETKSSAGDKHETGRAMLQLEREKVGKQLAEAQKLQEVLTKIKLETDPDRIHLGSVVETSQANYFISISIGKLTIDTKDYYAIAVGSPIGKLLLGKKTGDYITFNGNKIVIQKIT